MPQRTSQTYNIVSVISNMREVYAHRSTFARGKISRHSPRDTNVKITESALRKARAAGLDFTGPLNLFGRFQLKPCIGAVELIFVVIGITPVRTA